MQKLVQLIFIFAITILVASAGSAQQTEKRIALVIGNGAYQAEALTTTANDAGLIAQTRTRPNQPAAPQTGQPGPTPGATPATAQPGQSSTSPAQPKTQPPLRIQEGSRAHARASH
jgi:hypothetical protein